MRPARTISALCILLMLSVGPLLAGGEVNLLVGQKSSGESLFEEAGVEDQSLTGLAVDVDFDWPVLFAVDLLMSSDDAEMTFSALNPVTVDTEVETIELDLGVRKKFGNRIVPYVGAGISICQLDVDQTVSGSLGPGSEFTDTILDNTDSDFGFWAGAGLLYRIGGHINVGVDVRYSSAKPELSVAGEDTDIKFQAGGNHYSLLLGYRW